MSKDYTTKEKRVRNLRYIAVLLAAVFVVSGALLAVNVWENHQAQFPSFENGTIGSDVSFNGNEYELKDGVETVLVLGLDK